MTSTCLSSLERYLGTIKLPIHQALMACIVAGCLWQFGSITFARISLRLNNDQYVVVANGASSAYELRAKALAVESKTVEVVEADSPLGKALVAQLGGGGAAGLTIFEATDRSVHSRVPTAEGLKEVRERLRTEATSSKQIALPLIVLICVPLGAILVSSISGLTSLLSLATLVAAILAFSGCSVCISNSTDLSRTIAVVGFACLGSLLIATLALASRGYSSIVRAALVIAFTLPLLVQSLLVLFVGPACVGCQILASILALGVFNSSRVDSARTAFTASALRPGFATAYASTIIVLFFAPWYQQSTIAVPGLARLSPQYSDVKSTAALGLRHSAYPRVVLIAARHCAPCEELLTDIEDDVLPILTTMYVGSQPPAVGDHWLAVPQGLVVPTPTLLFFYSDGTLAETVRGYSSSQSFRSKLELNDKIRVFIGSKESENVSR